MIVIAQPRQPRLHALEHGALADAFPLRRSPWFALQQQEGSGAHVVRRTKFAATEQLHRLDRLGRPLVMHTEFGEPVDLIPPEVDAHRHIAGRTEHVDDRTADRHLAPVLDLVLTAIAEIDQTTYEFLRVDLVAGADHDRRGFLDVRAKPLQQRLDRSDDDCGCFSRTTGEVPHGLQTSAHGLNGGAHPFERQGLPRREHVDSRPAEVRPKVGRDAIGVVRGWGDDDQRSAATQLGKSGEHVGTGRIGDADRSRSRPEEIDETGVGAEEGRKGTQRHGRTTLVDPVFSARRAGTVRGPGGTIAGRHG